MERQHTALSRSRLTSWSRRTSVAYFAETTHCSNAHFREFFCCRRYICNFKMGSLSVLLPTRHIVQAPPDRSWFVSRSVCLVICPIAIAYSMGQIIKSVCVCVCVCVSVCLSVCGHSHGRISWSIFTKIGTDVRTPKSKNEFVGGQYRTTPSPILPPKTPIFGQEVLKTHANIK